MCPQALQALPVIWKRLAGAPRVRDLDSRSFEAHQGKSHGHAVVVVGLDYGRGDWSRRDPEAIGELLDLLSQAAQLGRRGGDAVAFL